MSDPKYICQRCTNCCRWPGFVRLTNEDITRIASYLKQSEFRFIQTYTRLRPHRDGLALQDRGDGSCVFLDGQSCAIHPVKPAQWTSRNCWRHFIKLHFSHIMHFYQNFDLLRLLSYHMGSPDSLSHGFYCPYQIGFTLVNISIEFRRVKWVHLYTFQ